MSFIVFDLHTITPASASAHQEPASGLARDGDIYGRLLERNSYGGDPDRPLLEPIRSLLGVRDSQQRPTLRKLV